MTQFTDPPFDCLAVGAHPDDVEIAIGGTLAQLVRLGYRVGIVDLTDGEPTPHSPGPEFRLAEARHAAETLGVQMRVQCNLPNRRLFDCFEARVELAKVFRRYRPRLVLGLGSETSLASPDHYQAKLITDAAVFYSRLTKWDEYFAGLPVHQIAQLWHYTLDFGNHLHPSGQNRIVMDISETLEIKLAAIRCYASQFPPAKAGIFDRVRAYALQQGASAGYSAGEMLASPKQLGTKDLLKFALG
jgi:N-acetylglucosamine malate deacetylase 1